MLTSTEETIVDVSAREQLTSAYKTKELSLTNEQIEFMSTKLTSKLWRLDNLYTIRDKDGVKRKLKLNNSQKKVLTQFKHNKKIILKSRQQGISTLFLAYYLDSCIFIPGYSAGIQSYGQDEADKLAKRAELMWDEFDEDVKALLSISLASNNSKGMTFSNGSVLKIGNFRGDTLQGLHVSELGKIAKRYPEKAKELKTGAFQAVSTKNKITIESTAEGQVGLFYEMWQTATTRMDAVGGDNLTSLDFQPVFLSWMEDPDCQLFEEYPQTEKSLKYISELEKEFSIVLTDSQRSWVAAKLVELGDDFDQEYPSSPEKAFAQQIDGMYFRNQYIRLKEDKRIQSAPYNAEYPVSVSFDLGLNDETVLLFAQVIHGTPYIIDEYQNKDEGILFYSDILKSKPYVGNYNKIIFPHDINVRDYSTGRTRLETFQREGWTNVVVLPKLSFSDSIEAARQFIDISIISQDVLGLLLAIQNYRKKYDRALGVFLSTDVHDIHSNYAAALRYLAQGLGYYLVANSRPKSQKEQWIEKKSNYYKGFAL